MRVNARTLLTIFFGFIAGVFAYAQSEELSLAVSVSGAEPEKGQVLFSLFTNQDNYLSDPVLSGIEQVDPLGESLYIFGGLAQGQYAVSVVYDQDSDGELDTGFLGIPKEKVGLSNNAKGSFGPPAFEKSVFVLDRSMQIEINLEGAAD